LEFEEIEEIKDLKVFETISPNAAEANVEVENTVEVEKTVKEKLIKIWDRFLFKPSSPFKIKWDILIILLSVWNSVEIPF
jgi:hypothetical protein